MENRHRLSIDGEIVQITDEDIDDIMLKGLPSVNGSWCFRWEMLGDQLAKYPYQQISHGGMIKLYSSEPEIEPKYWLTLTKFLEGFRKFCLNHDRKYGAIQFGRVHTGLIDEIEANQIIQLAVLGEVLF